MMEHKAYMIFWVVMGFAFVGSLMLYWEFRGSKLLTPPADSSSVERRTE